MSSKRSEILPPRWNGWLSTLLCNLPIPLLILLMMWIGTYADSREFLRQHDLGWHRNVVADAGYAIILAVSLQLINGFSGQFSLGHIGFMMVGGFLAAYPVKAYSAKYTDPGAMLMFFIALFITTAVLGVVLYLVFITIRWSRRFHASVPSILIAGLFIWLMVDFALAQHHKDAVPWYFLWTHGVNGIGNLFTYLTEHGTVFGTKLTGYIPSSLRSATSILVAIVGGATCAGGVGFIVGLPALRLRGDYLAIATLGMGEIINRVIILTPALGGALGLTGIPRIRDTTAAKEAYLGEFAWLYAMVIITVAVIWRLAYSAKGRAIMAVREDEIAAKAVGIDATHHKVVAFVIGAFFAGVAGALYAMQKTSLDPKSFTMTRSIEIVVMVTLGGLGSISGAVLAAVLLTILPEQLREPRSAWPWGFIVVGIIFALLLSLNWRRHLSSFLVCVGLLILWQAMIFAAEQYGVKLPDLRMVIYSLMLVLMMLLRPQGLLGGRELWFKRRAPRREAAPTEEPPQPAMV